MTAVEAIVKMIEEADGNLHDIAHFLKVHAYARLIGNMEKLDEKTQLCLELAAVVHDIACPLCREKYGNTNGHLQEKESAELVERFFAGTDVEGDMIERISWIVSHHHTYHLSEMLEYQILLEADYLVNADESSYPKEALYQAKDALFVTESGRKLLTSIYQL